MTEVAKKLLLTHADSVRSWTRESQATKDAGRTRYRTEPTAQVLLAVQERRAIGWALDGPPASRSPRGAMNVLRRTGSLPL